MMFLKTIELNNKSTASEIVKQDYRMAEVLKKYGIDYCCGGRWPLDQVCQDKQIEIDDLMEDLKRASRTLQLSTNLAFESWSIDFLTDYIVNVHHHYLLITMPGLIDMLHRFSEEHIDKYPYYQKVNEDIAKLEKEIFPHIRQEEEVIFPYLQQIAHAHQSRESFGRLLVATLRKPIEKVMQHEHKFLLNNIYAIRDSTNNYTVPPQACPSHRVVLSKLKELDNDLVQHIYLENEILFPRIIAMEKQLLASS
jgi:regulator of cell morphogenesis and NO signaling